ncbi:translation initiation factor IF-2-like [Onychomys torridus]|uniref:translation initiation factor IF-2-like n=1 Tax=Onychomys torridus TaxID=38674 RepID=UPI00167FC368|nr:translation initiation factor IF-2-like [Onychomys torridus]
MPLCPTPASRQRSRSEKHHPAAAPGGPSSFSPSGSCAGSPTDPLPPAVLPGPPPSGPPQPRGVRAALRTASASVGLRPGPPPGAPEAPPLGTLLPGVVRPASPRDPPPATSAPPPVRPRPGPALLLSAPKLGTFPKPGAGVRGEPTRLESRAGAGRRRGPSARVAPVARSVQKDADENRAGAEAAGRPRAEGLPCLPLPARGRVVAARSRTRGCGARASVSAAGRASGAGRGAEGSRGGRKRWRLSRVCSAGSSRGGRARLLPPSRPPRAAAPSPSAPRGFLQSSARVSPDSRDSCC